MAIIITKELLKSKSYPELMLEVPQGTERVAVTYTVESIESITNGQGVVNYSISVEGEKSPAWRRWSFPYDGKANPFEAAEKALKAYLTGKPESGE